MLVDPLVRGSWLLVRPGLLSWETGFLTSVNLYEGTQSFGK